VRENSCLDALLLRESEPWGATARLEDNILALEEDVTENSETNALVGLDTTEASAVADRSVVDELAGNNLLNASDSNS
jgi:hypothetical protein